MQKLAAGKPSLVSLVRAALIVDTGALTSCIDEAALTLMKTNPAVLKKTDPCNAQLVEKNGCS